MNNDKYEFTGETKDCWGSIVKRIRAKKDFGNIKKGEIGGWIEEEENLSVNDNSWVRENAIVSGNARVYGNALVCEDAWVFTNARIYGNARVYGDAQVGGNAQVYGNAQVHGNTHTHGNAQVYGNAKVHGNVWISGNTLVFRSARVNNGANIEGDAKVSGIGDYAVYKNTWSSGRWFTYTRSNKMWSEDYFYGTGEELIAKAYKESTLSGDCYKAIVNAQLIIDNAINMK